MDTEKHLVVIEGEGTNEPSYYPTLIECPNCKEHLDIERRAEYDREGRYWECVSTCEDCKKIYYLDWGFNADDETYWYVRDVDDESEE